MRQNNIAKITKAIETIGNQPFSIADICKFSKLSDPTVRNYLKNSKDLQITETSYGKYIVGTMITPTNLPQNNSTNPTNKNTKNTNPNSNTDEQKDMRTKSNTTPQIESQTGEPSQQNNASKGNGDILQIHGEVYLNAYLKGFDRGFELGLKKAQELAQAEK